MSYSKSFLKDLTTSPLTLRLSLRRKESELLRKLLLLASLTSASYLSWSCIRLFRNSNCSFTSFMNFSDSVGSFLI